VVEIGSELFPDVAEDNIHGLYLANAVIPPLPRTSDVLSFYFLYTHVYLPSPRDPVLRIVFGPLAPPSRLGLKKIKCFFFFFL
jgi:hypothetical protein